MGLLSRTYRTKMRLVQGSNQEFEVDWVRCRPGAKIFQGVYRTHPEFMQEDFAHPSTVGIGEVEEAGRKYIPTKLSPWPGDCVTGDPAWFDTGVPLEALQQPPPRACCAPARPARLGLGGRSVWGWRWTSAPRLGLRVLSPAWGAGTAPPRTWASWPDLGLGGAVHITSAADWTSAPRLGLRVPISPPASQYWYSWAQLELAATLTWSTSSAPRYESTARLALFPITTQWVFIPGDDMITGGFLAYPSTSVPAGYLACDGSAVSRTTYAALFAVCGTTFGAGDGVTTFNVPDLRGRPPIGADPTGVHLPVNHPAIGAAIGQEQHQLTIAELATHSHPTPSGHNFVLDGPPGGVYTAGPAGNISAVTAVAGANTPHNNVQPSLAVQWLIKT